MTFELGRREFLRQSLLAAPFALTTTHRAAAQQPPPNSRIHGVQIGAITGSFGAMPAAQIIPALLQVGLSEVELQSNHAEILAGAPIAERSLALAAPQTLNAAGLLPRCAAMPIVLPLSRSGPGIELAPPTAEQQEARDRLWRWRRQTTPETWRSVRRRFEDKGIEVRMLWYGLGYSGPPDVSEEEIDYAFRMAKGLGVRGVAGSTRLQFASQIARAAAKYGLTFAGHTQDNFHNPELLATPDAYERFLAAGDHMRVCLDIGYFTAAGFDALAYIEKNHRRVSDIHLKDRKRSAAFGADVTNNAVNNWPFGEGDSPIRETLQLLKRERWDIPVQLEFDYGCRTVGDATTELSRAYAYCRAALSETGVR